LEAKFKPFAGGFYKKEKKEGQATYIAPLQPPTLASFRTWGSSAGAGRVRLALGGAKVKIIPYHTIPDMNFFYKYFLLMVYPVLIP